MKMRILSLLVLCISSKAKAFMSQQRQQHAYSFHGHAHLKEMEEARRHFESMIGPLLFDRDPLTNASRKRRQVEIRLLRSLRHSDDAVDELMSLWIHECPCKTVSTNAVKFMDFECSVTADEATLRNILADCTVATWPEPAARLALILFNQGRYVECREYTDAVVAVKPWHFEALQLQVLLRLVNRDYAAAIVAARAGLPPVTQFRRRAAWIERAVSQAVSQLNALELQTATVNQEPQPSTTAWQ